MQKIKAAIWIIISIIMAGGFLTGIFLLAYYADYIKALLL